MLEIFRKLKSGPVSAQALREARAALDPHVAETTVRKREDARREAIVSGDLKAITAAETALADARMELERVEIAVQELEARIAAADKREADAAVKVRIREVEARRDALRRRVERELVPALRTACDILADAAALDDEIEAANRDIAQKGWTETIATVEEGVTPFPAGQLREIFELKRTTVIRPVEDWGIAGYGWQAPPFLGIAFAPREATDPKFRPTWR